LLTSVLTAAVYGAQRPSTVVYRLKNLALSKPSTAVARFQYYILETVPPRSHTFYRGRPPSTARYDRQRLLRAVNGRSANAT